MEDWGLFLREVADRGRRLLAVRSGRHLAAAAALAFAGFALFRLGGVGTQGSEAMLAAVREEIRLEAQQTLRAEAEALEAEGRRAEAHARRALYLGDEPLEVEIERHSIAAPLLDWGLNETVVVRFDFRVVAAGRTLAEGRHRHVLVRRWGLTDVQFVRPSGPLAYYMSFVI